MANKETLRKKRFDSQNCRFYHLKLNRRTDADLIAKLDSVPSMQGYIRSLIRKDIMSSDPVEDESEE